MLGLAAHGNHGFIDAVASFQSSIGISIGRFERRSGHFIATEYGLTALALASLVFARHQQCMSDSLIWTLESIAALKETDELEVKLAAGRDGRGELPKDFWPTYSSFANGAGGFVALGVREKSGNFSIDAGILHPDKVRGQIFDQACNTQKVSVNLLSASDVEVVEIGAKQIIVVRIPAASRQNKPVYIDGNPLTGTYKRVNDGDRLCDQETVKRMLAEQTEDSRDNRVLKIFPR